MITGPHLPHLCRLAALLLLFVLAACGSQSAGPARPQTQPSGSPTTSPPPAVPLAEPTRLLFTRWHDDTFGVYEVEPARSPDAKWLFDIGRYEVFGLTGTDNKVLWIEDETAGRVMIANRNGSDRHQLARGIGPALSDLLIVGPYAYWGVKGAVARIRLDGTHLYRDFISLPRIRPGDGEVEDGLATDGRYLYFAQCGTHSIGQVPLSRKASYTYRTVTWLTTSADCPQGLAYAAGNLYYSTLEDIGRLPVNTGESDDYWGNGAVRRGGPDNPTVVGEYLYWDWCGGPQCTPNGVGRLNLRTGAMMRNYLADTDTIGAASG